MAAPMLNFKEQHELKELPARIAKLDATLVRLQAMLDDPQLYVREPEVFDKALRELATTQAASEAALARWMELEEKAAQA